jgi:hypothetical protein
MKKKFKIIQLLLFLFICLSYSQTKTNKYGASLWIKGKEPLTVDESKLATYFNFNSIVRFTKNAIPKNYKNLITKGSSLFIVFKSIENDEVELFSIKKAGYNVAFTNKQIKSDKEVLLDKVNAKQGALVSYINCINSSLSKKKGTLCINDLLFEEEKGINELMELIYIPKVITELDKNSIESYLSIKYGISLTTDKNYYCSSRKKIWNATLNSEYNHSVTGIGRDDLLNLNQNQSGNSKKEGLYIGINKVAVTNAANHGLISDKTFMLWGNNKGTPTLKQSNSSEAMKTMKKVWKVQTTSEDSASSIKTQICINTKELLLDNDNEEPIWIATDTTASEKFNYTAATYQKVSKSQNDTLYFDKMQFKNNTTSLFTFVKAPEIFVFSDVSFSNCSPTNGGKIEIKIVGGAAPYSIRLKSDLFEKSMVSNNTNFAVDDLPIGNYEVEVSSGTLTSKSNVKVNFIESNSITMSTQYNLNSDNEVIIAPLISTSKATYTYEWFKKDTLISTENKITLKETGNYILVVTNDFGCKKDFPFIVFTPQNTVENKYVLSPNPVKSGAIFSIQFQFSEVMEVTIIISELNGKIIRSKNLGSIQTYEYKDSLLTSGTYLITVIQNGISQTTKLIIQ